MKKFLKIAALCLATFLPQLTLAHEVYVLDKGEIARSIAMPPLDLFSVAMADKSKFFSIVFLGIIAVVCVLGISISRRIEDWIDPILFKIKPYASHITQITLGLALIASAYNGALFGLELPLDALFDQWSSFINILLCIAGISIILGFHARLGSFLVLMLYVSTLIHGGIGTYLFGYLTYFGEALFIFLFGGGYALFEHKPHFSGRIKNLIEQIEKRKYFLIRIAFSASLIYAALYAKLIHGGLALNTVLKYNLADYLHFDPLFIVLGAFLVEMTIAIFYLIGFELRFTSLLFLVFLSVSLVFFGEAVWPHIILIGTALAMFVHGYDEYTIERVWYKKDISEPVL